MKIEYFFEKVKLGKFSTESENFSEIGGNLIQREMHHCLRGMDAPGYYHPFPRISPIYF